VKVGISGAQGTGKSTIIKKLKVDKTICDKYELVEEITRNVKRKGLDINNQGKQYNLTQLLIMNGHIENSLIQNSILDRCALDGLVYTKYLWEYGKVETWVMDYALRVFEMLLPKYNHIFYIPPEFKIHDDGVRSVDTGFRDDIVRIFELYISTFNINPIKLTGSVDERVKTVKQYLDDTKKEREIELLINGYTGDDRSELIKKHFTLDIK